MRPNLSLAHLGLILILSSKNNQGSLSLADGDAKDFHYSSYLSSRKHVLRMVRYRRCYVEYADNGMSTVLNRGFERPAEFNGIKGKADVSSFHVNLDAFLALPLPNVERHNKTSITTGVLAH